MNRRGFLQMIGAATAAPLLPALPVAAAPAATQLNSFTYGMVALHSRIEGGLPLAEMARRFRLSPAQANYLADRLVSDGFATRTRTVVTARKPFVQSHGFGRMQARARTERQIKRRHNNDADKPMPPMLAHLRRLSADYGLTLRPARLT